jgi:hypothetical protein
MAGMVNNIMYQDIKKLKISGRSRNQISRELSIDIKTVRKYWNMSDAEYQKSLMEFTYREKEFEGIKTDILNVYAKNDYIRLNMSAVYDYLQELKEKLPANENTMRNYIHYLIESRQLVLNDKRRYYTKVPDMPYGKQFQLDFGQHTDRYGRKYYIFAAVLSSSRFKYAALQERPFRTEDLIGHLLDCFAYMGGMPQELVIDQDCTMVVSENSGDIIYTKDFQYFIEEMGLQMYVCRPADPESKGKIENLVKFIKFNFFAVREFNSLLEACESLLKWLERKANGRISQATMKIPLIEMETERQFLRPVRNSIFRKDRIGSREERSVSDKCRISVDTSQYDIPEIYRNGSVDIYKTGSRLFVYDRISGRQIAEYPLSAIPGQIVTNKAMVREMGKSARLLKEEVSGYFDIPGWKEFLECNFKKFTRYVRDQCLSGRKYFKDRNIDSGKLAQALKNCLENNSYSMNDLWDNYQNCLKTDQAEIPLNVENIVRPAVDPRHYLEVAKPDIGKYQSLCNSAGGPQC